MTSPAGPSSSSAASELSCRRCPAGRARRSGPGRRSGAVSRPPGPPTQRRDELQLGPGKDLACGVVRAVEQEQAGPRGHRRPQLGRIEPEHAITPRPQQHRPPHRAGHRDRRGVGVVVGLEQHYLVTGLAQPEEGGGHRLGGARGDGHLAVRAVRGLIAAGPLTADGQPQLGDAGEGRVLVRSGVDGVAGRGEQRSPGRRYRGTLAPG